MSISIVKKRVVPHLEDQDSRQKEIEMVNSFG
jgi:hypothetical protein